jgi:shikimate kinase
VVFLTGMMGSGKSTVGRLLARRLGWDFADTDAMVVRRSRRSVARIFESKGEGEFRRLESLALRSLGGDVVVATGGGTVTRASNRAWMSRKGRVVYLKVPLKVLARRVAAQGGLRPLAKDLPGLYKKRLPLYRLAHCSVDANQAPAKVVAAILLKIRTKVPQVLHDKTAR